MGVFVWKHMVCLVYSVASDKTHMCSLLNPHWCHHQPCCLCLDCSEENFCTVPTATVCWLNSVKCLPWKVCRPSASLSTKEMFVLVWMTKFTGKRVGWCVGCSLWHSVWDVATHPSMPGAGQGISCAHAGSANHNHTSFSPERRSDEENLARAQKGLFRADNWFFRVL